jgi:hypothetical protein
LSGGPFSTEFIFPKKFPAKTDIRVTAIASTAGGIGDSELTGWLE